MSNTQVKHIEVSLKERLVLLQALYATDEMGHPKISVRGRAQQRGLDDLFEAIKLTDIEDQGRVTYTLDQLEGPPDVYTLTKANIEFILGVVAEGGLSVPHARGLRGLFSRLEKAQDGKYEAPETPAAP